MNPDDDIAGQMDKDFEDYKKKMAEGMYPEAERVEQEVREMKEINPDLPEDYLRKLAVSSIAATKRLRKLGFSNIDISKCWSIMPFVLCEGEEARWWVVGEDITCPYGEFAEVPTREEAFAIALKHNKEHGLDAVYVHALTFDGGESEIASKNGFFQWEEPPTEAQATSLMEAIEQRKEPPAEAKPTPMEESIMQIGDQAMHNVLKDLRRERRRSKISKLITSIKDGVTDVFADDRARRDASSNAASNMSTIDASKCWRIMPFSLFEGGEDWWVLGPDSQPVRIVPTREEAFAIALEHNKPYGVPAVYVHGECMKNGKWEKPPR
jgi:hypothetical protein